MARTLPFRLCIKLNLLERPLYPSCFVIQMGFAFFREGSSRLFWWEVTLSCREGRGEWGTAGENQILLQRCEVLLLEPQMLMSYRRPATPLEPSPCLQPQPKLILTSEESGLTIKLVFICAFSLFLSSSASQLL